MNNLVYLAFNKSSSALSSEKVRQAVALAIDRAKLADESFQGHAKAAYTPFNPDWNVISGKDYTVKTDLEAAGKLLDEAGYTSKMMPCARTQTKTAHSQDSRQQR